MHTKYCTAQDAISRPLPFISRRVRFSPLWPLTGKPGEIECSLIDISMSLSVQSSCPSLAPSKPDLSDRGSPESTMDRETPRAEVLRLLKELRKTRQDEIFGGLSLSERADYDKKANRISELELLLESASLSLFSEPDLDLGGAWDKMSETDTPQSLARQPYRDREKNSRDSQAESESPENPATKRANTDDDE